MTKKSGKGPGDVRNATTGEFAKKSTAKTNPKGTTTEHNRPPAKKK